VVDLFETAVEQQRSRHRNFALLVIDACNNVWISVIRCIWIASCWIFIGCV